MIKIPAGYGIVYVRVSTAHQAEDELPVDSQIEHRGHLAHVTLAQVRAHIAAHELDETELILEDELVFDQADPTTLLKLLNEDLFRGGLTGEPFIVDRKAPRPR